MCHHSEGLSGMGLVFSSFSRAWLGISCSTHMKKCSEASSPGRKNRGSIGQTRPDSRLRGMETARLLPSEAPPRSRRGSASKCKRNREGPLPGHKLVPPSPSSCSEAARMLAANSVLIQGLDPQLGKKESPSFSVPVALLPTWDGPNRRAFCKSAFPSFQSF